MPTMYCSGCHKNIKVGPRGGEQFCADHPEVKLRTKRAGSDRAPGRKGSASYSRARAMFANNVCATRCFFASLDEFDERVRPDHRCNTNRLEAHHLVEKSWIERNYPDLPEDDFLEIIFNWRIGAPLCPSAHHLITVHSDYIYLEEVRIECVEFCEYVDDLWLDIPLPSGVRRQSMLDRLKSQSPKRPEEVERSAA